MLGGTHTAASLIEKLNSLPADSTVEITGYNILITGGTAPKLLPAPAAPAPEPKKARTALRVGAQMRHVAPLLKTDEPLTTAVVTEAMKAAGIATAHCTPSGAHKVLEHLVKVGIAKRVDGGYLRGKSWGSMADRYCWPKN